jgi:hypothetical protein
LGELNAECGFRNVDFSGSSIEKVKRVLIGLIIGLVGLAGSSNAQEAKLIDEFGDFCCESFRARMDNFFQELSNRPAENGVAIFYAGKNHPICNSRRSPKRGEIEVIMKTFENHMKLRGIPVNRIEIKFGGYKETWGAEFWLVVNGRSIPKPKPTVQKLAAKFRSGKARRIDLRCEP